MATTKRKHDVLVLRTCSMDMSSRGGFKWPKKGRVKCDDWHPTKQCGNGLHGWLWGEGDGGLADWDYTARWLVVSVDPKVIVDLEGKVKFPHGIVVFCGDRFAATEYLATHGGAGKAIIGGTATAGYGGTATAGYGGTATAGNGGTATAGDYGTATAGDRGTATAGDRGTATAGNGGNLIIKRWDGQYYQLSVAHVGENGIKPNTKYRLDKDGNFEEAK